MLKRRRQTHGQRRANRPRPPARLQEVNLSAFSSMLRACEEMLHGCNGLMLLSPDILTNRSLYSPLCSIPSVRDEVCAPSILCNLFNRKISNSIYVVSNLTWYELSKNVLLHTVTQNCRNLRKSLIWRDFLQLSDRIHRITWTSTVSLL